MVHSSNHRLNRVLLGAIATLLGLATTGVASAQSFDSGSTGEDGAFVATPPAGANTVEFDPRRIHRNNDPQQPLIDPERDNVFHFTTITIPAGVTLKMSARWTNGPVYLLAKGLPGMAKTAIAVRISGTIDFSGEHGANMSHSAAARGPAVPGPGGYYGGLGGNWQNVSTGSHGQDGLGPFGGLGAPSVFHADRGQSAQQHLGGPQLIPLVGGSGGGGGNHAGMDWFGGGGGAGGGALLISTSNGIQIDAGARVYGGGGYGGRYTGCNNHFGGGGAGGSLRLAAYAVTGSGELNLWPGLSALGSCGTAAPYTAPAGRIRIDAFENSQTYTFPNGPSVSFGSPLSSFIPSTPPPTLQVSGVDGQTVAADPTGSFDLADVTINDSGPVEITIQARNVPVVSGASNTPTVPKLYLFSLEGRDLVLDGSNGMTALSGNFASSTATVTVTLPSGFTRGYVRASWTVP